MSLDRLQLEKALFSINSCEKKLYTWSQKLNSSFMFPPMGIDCVGTIKTPLGLECINELLCAYSTKTSENNQSLAPYHAKICCVPEKNIYEPSASRGFIRKAIASLKWKALEKTFNVNMENLKVNVEIYIEMLLVCQPAGTYEDSLSSRKRPGSFGRMILQLPIQNEKAAGARVSVVRGERVETFDMNEQTQSHFYIACLAGERDSYNPEKFSIQPAADNPIAILVFDLVWTDAFPLTRVLGPDIFPKFLQAAHQASLAINGWNKDSHNMNQVGAASDSINQSEYTKNKFSHNAEEVNKLCVPLNNNYFAHNFHPTNLQNEDLKRFAILRAIRFLDVNLVVLKVRLPNREKCFHDLCQSDSDDSIPELTSESSWDSSDSASNFWESDGWETCEDSDVDHCDEDCETSSSSSESEGEQGARSKRMRTYIDWKKEALSRKPKELRVHRWVADGAGNLGRKKSMIMRADTYLVGDITSLVNHEYNEQSMNDFCPMAILEHAVNVGTKYYHPALIIQPRSDSMLQQCRENLLGTVKSFRERLGAALGEILVGEITEKELLIQDVSYVLNYLKHLPSNDKPTTCNLTPVFDQLLYICTRLGAVDEGIEVMEAYIEERCDCNKHLKRLVPYFTHEVLRDFQELLVEFICLAGWEKCSIVVCRLYLKKDNVRKIMLIELSRRLLDFNCKKAAICLGEIGFLLHNKNPRKEFDTASGNLLHLALSLPNEENLSRTILDFYTSYFSVESKSLAHLLNHLLYVGSQQIINSANFQDWFVTLVQQVNPNMLLPFDCMSIIRLLQPTKNSELIEKMWNEMCSTTDIKNGCSQFVAALIIHGGTAFDVDMYESLSRSTMAKEAFNGFFESLTADSKWVEDESTLLSCCRHVAQAETILELANPQRLLSFCRVLRQLETNCLKNLAFKIREDELEHGEEKRTDYQQKICDVVLETLLTRDNIVTIDLESNDFARTVDCFLVLAKQDQQLKFVNLVKQRIVPYADQEENSSCNNSMLILRTWLSCLISMAKDKKYDSAVAAQVVHYLAFFDSTEEVELKSTVKEFLALLDNMSIASLEQALIQLLDREKEFNPCMKTVKARWKLCQKIADSFSSHSGIKKAFLKLDPDHIVKLMKCMFWLGSEKSIKLFTKLICSIPFSASSVCICKLIVINDEAVTLAGSSPAGVAAIDQLADHSMKRLSFDMETRCSWARPDIAVEGHPQVEQFYRSAEKSKEFGPFEKHSLAKKYGEAVTRTLDWAAFTVRKTGQFYLCEITKKRPTLGNGGLAESFMVEAFALKLNAMKAMSGMERYRKSPMHHLCPVCVCELL